MGRHCRQRFIVEADSCGWWMRVSLQALHRQWGGRGHEEDPENVHSCSSSSQQQHGHYNRTLASNSSRCPFTYLKLITVSESRQHLFNVLSFITQTSNSLEFCGKIYFSRIDTQEHNNTIYEMDCTSDYTWALFLNLLISLAAYCLLRQRLNFTSHQFRFLFMKLSVVHSRIVLDIKCAMPP